MPKVSVIIPTYNRANYICEAIDSALNQTYRDFEIIIVDDGSADNTKEVLSKYNSKIRYFYQKNRGEASARNKGIEVANGEYIAFLDSDDIWLADKLKRQVEILDTHSEIALTYCRAIRINERGLVLDIKPTAPALKFEDFLEGKRIPMTVLVRKKCFDEIGLFDSGIKVGVDTDMWLRSSLKYKFHFIDESLGIIKTHDSNISLNKAEGNLGHLQIYHKLYAGKTINQLPKSFLRNLMAKEYYCLARIYFYEHKDFKLASKFSIKALKDSLFLGRNFTDSNDKMMIKILKIIKPYAFLFFSLIRNIYNHKNMKKINILYYEPTTGYGGSSRCLLAWLKKLDREKYKPIVVVFQDGPAIQKIYELGVDVFRMPYKPFIDTNYVPLFSHLKFLFNFLVFDIPMALFICTLVKKYQIKIIHLNAKVISVIPGIIAAKLSNIPCICHLHDTKIPATKRERFFGRWVDYYVALTEKAKELYEKVYSNKKIKLIFNGIDLDEYYNNRDINKIKESLYIKTEDKVVGIVGRLVEGKGFSDFIRAAKIILTQTDKVKFVIVGSAPYESKDYGQYLKQLTKELGIEEKIMFTGWREDVKEIVSTFNILVHASSTFAEGFPLTCIEGMTLSKPLVVTNIHGPAEIVVDGVTGFVVPPANPEKMAEKIINLITNSELAEKMGRAGRLRTEQLFDIRKTTKQIENIYSELLKGVRRCSHQL